MKKNEESALYKLISEHEKSDTTKYWKTPLTSNQKMHKNIVNMVTLQF